MNFRKSNMPKKEILALANKYNLIFDIENFDIKKLVADIENFEYVQYLNAEKLMRSAGLRVHANVVEKLVKILNGETVNCITQSGRGSYSRYLDHGAALEKILNFANLKFETGNNSVTGKARYGETMKLV